MFDRIAAVMSSACHGNVTLEQLSVGEVSRMLRGLFAHFCEQVVVP